MSRLSRWLVIFLCGVALTLVSVIASSDALYFVSGFLLMLPLGTCIFGWLSLQSLTVHCLSPVPVHAGETLEVPLEALNRGVIPRFDLQITLSIPGSPAASTIIPFLPGGGKSRSLCSTRAVRRGVFDIASVGVSHLDPLKLCSVRRRLPCSREVVVFPRLLDVFLAPLLSGDLMGSEGTTRSRGSTEGIDFFGIRSYRSGDEWRRIHWPTTARTGSLAVVEREAVSSHSLALVIDLAAAKDNLEILISAAASLAEDAARRMSMLYLILLTAEGEVSLVLHHSSNASAAFETLARIDPARPVESQPVERLPSLAGWGPSLLLLTDHLDDRTRAAAGVCSRAGWSGAVVLLDVPARSIARTGGSTALPVWLLKASAGEKGYHVEPMGQR